MQKLCAVTLLLPLLCGCVRDGESGPNVVFIDDGNGDPIKIASSTDSLSGVDSPTLEIADWDGVQAMIAEHTGKIVVVDLWSTWCLPCVKEFPKLVELHEKHGESVVCMSVNVNYTGGDQEPPESFREEIEAFLTKRKANFRNVISATPDLELYAKIDLGAVPAVFIYDRDGSLHKRLDNDTGEFGDAGFNYEQHIYPVVERLLTASETPTTNP